ncbi:AraC family transcriptional regulator [Echinicola vietnamensis]|uniref:DNA-binding domain-containing protein, AraC-type n=1 Tax=Echinicola vietnamensis (strain DSM 17526 / LMG 23754 / KMM 6221) TaxID=926556 RepID=L0G4E4_ECHVK|nr:helix-turn-helix domain-containing protein [Echinicola vietnamensis]AGA79886.1 DNA-binding domain-containing protein, AraC-type [Echinicola vietnamensis DSM 17526]
MDYQTYEPHIDLKSLVSCYWTLEVPMQNEPQKQRIVPDGCIEMAFILGDDIKRYTSENKFILQPRAMVLGQTVEPFFIEPTGFVKTFAIRFYPYGFANFVYKPIPNLVNKETPLNQLFEVETVTDLEQKIIKAKNTEERINIIEKFLLDKLNDEKTINAIVKNTVDSLLSTNGKASITSIFKDEPSKRRQLERNFKKQIGLSPKKLGKLIRLQTALKMLLNQQSENLTDIAHNSEYFDQAHFIKDFREFTGINPKEFIAHESFALSALFYK